jgi:hypothetical protein
MEQQRKIVLNLFFCNDAPLVSISQPISKTLHEHLEGGKTLRKLLEPFSQDPYGWGVYCRLNLSFARQASLRLQLKKVLRKCVGRYRCLPSGFACWRLLFLLESYCDARRKTTQNKSRANLLPNVLITYTYSYGPLEVQIDITVNVCMRAI